MHLCRYMDRVRLLGARRRARFRGASAVVYKWIDADGVVHFSDQPVPGAEK